MVIFHSYVSLPEGNIAGIAYITIKLYITLYNTIYITIYNYISKSGFKPAGSAPRCGPRPSGADPPRNGWPKPSRWSPGPGLRWGNDDG